MRQTLKSIARAMLLFLLATQVVLAAVPCVSASARPADAFVHMPGDCEQSPPPSLCLQHCIAGDQSSGQVSPPLPAPPLQVLHVLPSPRLEVQRFPVLTGPPAARAAGPPIPIRNLSLLL